MASRKLSYEEILKELVERLNNIEKLLEDEVPKGIPDTFQNLTITDVPTDLAAPKDSLWFSFFLLNDGLNNVNTIVNTENGLFSHEVRPTETYNIDMHRALIINIRLVCPAGLTSTIRMVCVR